MKKTLLKEELEALYRTNLNKEVCQMLEISHGTLVSLLKKFKIKMKKKGNKLSKSKFNLK